MITVVLADNHPIIRAGIRALVSEMPDIQILGETDNSSNVQLLVEQFRPRVLLIDLKMLGHSIVENIKWLRIQFPETAILVLTAHNHVAYLASMMNGGAAGLLDMGISATSLLGAIRLAAQNEILFDQEQMDRVEQWHKSAGEKWASLSMRQKQILQLLAQGVTKADVAAQLSIKPRMVDYHIGEFLKRLKVKSLTDAVNWLHKYFPENLGS